MRLPTVSQNHMQLTNSNYQSWLLSTISMIECNLMILDIYRRYLNLLAPTHGWSRHVLATLTIKFKALIHGLTLKESRCLFGISLWCINHSTSGYLACSVQSNWSRLNSTILKSSPLPLAATLVLRSTDLAMKIKSLMWLNNNDHSLAPILLPCVCSLI